MRLPTLETEVEHIGLCEIASYAPWLPVVPGVVGRLALRNWILCQLQRSMVSMGYWGGHGRSEDQCTFTWPKVLSSLKTLGIWLDRSRCVKGIKRCCV